jgi:hypothetical protein
MTIKTQGGKVITKDGKVSCECCEVGCCMYAAQALVDAIYTADDLPDDVTVDGASFSRSGTTYGNTTNGVILEGNVWAKYRNGARSTRPCLIQGGVVDQFADTYTATSPGAESYTLTRVSLCVWIGPEPDLYSLRYFDNSASEPQRCKWALIDSVKDAGQFQNTPTGNYTQPGDESPWIVS